MNLKYDWTNYPDIYMFFMKIYFNTLTYTEMYLKDDTFPQKILTDIEEYLYYFRKHNYDISLIKNKINEFLYIGNFNNINSNELFKYGDKVIYLNNLIKGNDRLLASEMKRLSLYLGLNNYLFTFNNDKANTFSRLYSSLFGNVERTETLVNNGWLLLKDVLSRELAERITYESLDKTRPNNNSTSKDLPTSNLEISYPPHDIVISLGGAISGVGSLYHHTELDIMNDLLKKSINTDIVDQIISEYIFNNNELELYLILYLMGTLYERYLLSRDNNIIYITSNNEFHNIYNKLKDLLAGLFTLDNDEYADIPIKEVPKNILLKKE